MYTFYSSKFVTRLMYYWHYWVKPSGKLAHSDYMSDVIGLTKKRLSFRLNHIVVLKKNQW